MNKQLIKNGIKVLTTEGVKPFLQRAKFHLTKGKNIPDANIFNFKDVLFINGCSVNYCERYRVHHKMQELIAYGMTVDEVNSDVIYPEGRIEEAIKHYSCFIIYRMPWDEFIDRLIKLAHENNKVVFFDVDDLIFDLEYTKDIKLLKTFSKEEKDLYDDGVKRYGKLLGCCDYGITTTTVIANEMKKHVKDVCIDKNIASLEMQKFSELAIEEVSKDDSKIVIGYASGSLTHNADFEMISPALMKILDKYENVYFKIIGLLEIPDEYKKYGDRILTSPFVDYQELPYLIRSFDINLAPLEDTFFNSAKSCIKWMEAGFVKVPTIASNVGDFKESITNGEDGILCENNQWYEAIEKLVVDSKLRKKIGDNAYNTVYNRYTPTTSGKIIAEFIKSKLSKKVAFVIPGATVSGGILVTTKHALILKKNGYDVSILNIDMASKDVTKLAFGDEYVDVISTINEKITAHIDTMIGTMWNTIFSIKEINACKDVRYLVQNKESGFYKPDRIEILFANASYALDDVKYLTISKWCQDWLKSDFGKESLYAPNGIDLEQFPVKKRDFNGKIKVLIEGDPESHYKNVDESFEITNKLDRDKYEVVFLSYNAQPKDWYKYDKFYNKIDHDEVYKVYQECDILLKSSLLESFSYPPIEMMATGGVCVVAPNGGNKEYLIDEENCLLYEQGNIEDAIEKINKVVSDKKLREKLIDNGLKTAANRSWDNIEKDILKLYE